MSIVEILNSENINSNLENWINECEKFRVWYHNLGIRSVNQIELEKAYFKIEPKFEIKNSLKEILKAK